MKKKYRLSSFSFFSEFERQGYNANNHSIWRKKFCLTSVKGKRRIFNGHKSRLYLHQEKIFFFLLPLMYHAVTCAYRGCSKDREKSSIFMFVAYSSIEGARKTAQKTAIVCLGTVVDLIFAPLCRPLFFFPTTLCTDKRREKYFATPCKKQRSF